MTPNRPHRRGVSRAWTWALGVPTAGLVALAGVHLATGDRHVVVALVHAGIGWWLAPAWLVAGLAAATRRTRIGAVAAGVAAVHLLRVAPGNVPRLERPSPLEAVRLGTINVLGVHPDPDRQIAALQALDADVWCVQELTGPFAARLARDPRWTHQHLEPDDQSSFGIGVVSRLPLHDVRTEDLLGVPMISARIGGQGPAAGVALACVHSVPPRTAAYTEDWADQLALLGRRLADRGPVVVLGDLNATRHHPSFRALARAAGVRDGLADTGQARARTWPAPPYFLRVPMLRLDHVLLPDALRAISARVAPPSGSDHLAVVVDVVRTR